MKRFLSITLAFIISTLLATTGAAAQNRVAEAAATASVAQSRAAARTAAQSRAIAATAQKRAIEALAEKYANHDGFTTTVVKGDLSRGFAGSLDIESIDISNILKDISSIVVVRSPRPDSVFTREVNEAVSSGYSTVLSSTDGDDRVRFLLSENGGGGGDRKEFVIFITGRSTNLVVSIVGDYTLGR